MDSKFNIDKAEHMFYHLASASKKIEARREIRSAINDSINLKNIVVQEPRKLTKREKDLISKLKKQVTSINKKISNMERSGNYDNLRLYRVQVKVKILRNRIKKIENK